MNEEEGRLVDHEVIFRLGDDREISAASLRGPRS